MHIGKMAAGNFMHKCIFWVEKRPPAGQKSIQKEYFCSAKRQDLPLQLNISSLA
jgi:hypothetical protein